MPPDGFTHRATPMVPELMTKLYVEPFPAHPLASVADTTIGKVPDTAGVPCKSPAVLKVKPAGKALDVLKVYGAVPPDALNDLLNGSSCVAAVDDGLVTVNSTPTPWIKKV